MSAPTNNPIKAKRLVFTGKQEVHLEECELAAPKDGEVLVRTEFSLMSTGTENIVFNRLFEAGTHWDKWVRYPFYPGYSAVGIVEAVGEGVDFKTGDRVAMRGRHQSHLLAKEGDFQPIPCGIPLNSAPWFALAKIAFIGALAADYRLGDSVLIIGAGPIGQMSTRWARASGAASIIVVDAMPERLALAQTGGATAVISSPIAEAREAILAANNGQLPRIVIDSTGNAQVFSQALALADKFGKVVLLGDSGTPASQKLTSDVIMRGITVIGAHDGHTTQKWTEATISSLFFALVSSGRFSLEGLNTHSFKPEECVNAYETANRERAKTMGIVFDWTH